MTVMLRWVLDTRYGAPGSRVPEVRAPGPGKAVVVVVVVDNPVDSPVVVVITVGLVLFGAISAALATQGDAQLGAKGLEANELGEGRSVAKL